MGFVDAWSSWATSSLSFFGKKQCIYDYLCLKPPLEQANGINNKHSMGHKITKVLLHFGLVKLWAYDENKTELMSQINYGNSSMELYSLSWDVTILYRPLSFLTRSSWFFPNLYWVLIFELVSLPHLNLCHLESF